MKPEQNQDPISNPVVAPSQSNGKRVIQPSESFKQEINNQPSVQTSIPEPVIVDQLNQQPIGNEQPPVGMSASQMSYNQPINQPSSLNLKRLLIKSLIALVVLGGIIMALVMTNFIALSEFKSVNYANSKGTSYKLDFYSKHGSKQLSGGNKQLVSKVSKDGKFPITVSISTTEASALNKNSVKTCGGALPKVFDVKNENVNKTISVCYFPTKNGPVGVYIAGFENNNQAHIITIGQDVSGTDLSSQSGAQASLAKFGIASYDEDIKRIVSSVRVE